MTSEEASTAALSMGENPIGREADQAVILGQATAVQELLVKALAQSDAIACKAAVGSRHR